MGCRRRAPKSDFLRIAAAPDGSLGFGPGAPGRGASLCRGSAECLETAIRRGSLARALRRALMADELPVIRAKLSG